MNVWSLSVNGTDSRERNKSCFAFCKEMEFGRPCTSTSCVVNIVVAKLFKLLYAMVVKIRAAGLKIYVSDLIPEYDVEHFHDNFLAPVGWQRGLVLDFRFPSSKSLPSRKQQYFADS